MSRLKHAPERTPVRCGGCGRQIALALRPGALRNMVFCDDWCLTEPPVSSEEVRNDRWQAMVGLGWVGLEVSRFCDVSHSLLYRTLDRLKVD